MKLRKIAVLAAIPAMAAVIGGCGGNSGNSSACTDFYKALGNTHESAIAYSNNLTAAANEASGQTQTDMMTVSEDVTGKYSEVL
jgi:hypothetical protein